MGVVCDIHIWLTIAFVLLSSHCLQMYVILRCFMCSKVGSTIALRDRKAKMKQAEAKKEWMIGILSFRLLHSLDR
jgi:hypothetical protein